MRDERLEIDAPGLDLVEEVRDQPPLRPADVADRVVVAARSRTRGRSGPARRSATAGAAAPCRRTGRRGTSRPTSPITDTIARSRSQLGGELDRAAVLRGRGEDDRVRAGALGARRDTTCDRVVAPQHGAVDRAVRERQLDARRGRDRCPRRGRPAAVASCAVELADQPEPDDGDDRAGGAPRRCGGRGPRSRRARRTSPSGRRAPRAAGCRAAPGSSDPLGVARDSSRRRTRRGRPAAMPVDARADLLDHAGARVAGRHRVVEPRVDRGERGADAVASSPCRRPCAPGPGGPAPCRRAIGSPCW